MKTTKPAINVNDMLTEEQNKAIALARFQNTPYFILTDAKESIIYEGDEKEARADFDAQSEDKEGIIDFFMYCADNLPVIEPIDGDEERDGYIVLTDEEADEMAKRYIIDTLWAFTPSFLASETGLDEEIFQAIADNGKCEDNNDTIYNTIKRLGDIDNFVSDAISADGRGHFMSSYDGNENEENVNGTTYFIYRIN